MNSKLKTFLQPPPQPDVASWALLILRIVAGTAFIIHGWAKITHPFDWMGPQAGVPGVLQFLAALAEFGGGVAWALGLLTPLACFAISMTMAVAVVSHAMVLHDPFVSPNGGSSFEMALDYFAVAFVTLFVGPGKFSFDRLIFGARHVSDPQTEEATHT
ncbi:MAG: DoxX family protein [Bdellovibrionales bacterium]|nr:DoxX family protein [Oligoflexia bacterium]